MLLYFELFGLKIPAYGTMALLGMAASLALAVRLAKRYGIAGYDVMYACCYGGFGLVLGAKLFYAIPFLGEFVSIWKKEGVSYIIQNAGEIFSRMFAGYVFYGGLLGLAAGVGLYVTYRKVPFSVYADVMAVVIPLFHGFGRIGCFLAGCCYGREYQGRFSVTFPENPYEPGIEAVSRFPVQLLESGCNFLLFFFLVLYGRKKHPAGRLMGIYLTAYPAIRFFTEFFRGDAVRGVLELGDISLSFSQFISLILFPIGLYFVYHTALEKN